MANEEHLEILKQGGEAWNNWRTNNPEVTLDLSGANLSQAYLTTILLPRANLCKANLSQAIINGTNLYRANLSGAFACRASFYLSDLRDADLSSADFSEANLSRAYLRGANLTGAILKEVNFRWADLRDANLSRANLSEANLKGANLSGANLSGANLSEANLKGANLSGANLSGANLSEANLRDAILSGTNTNLSGANMSGANLKGAQVSGVDLTGVGLIETQALETNFSRAKFTGACIKDWNINSVTNFDSVTCDYVFLKEFQQERRPHTGNFASGEFTKLFQKARETVDLIFRNGVDWQAFLVSFEQLQVEAGDKALFIQAIENKNDGAFIIRVSVPPELEKSRIEQYFKRKYQLAIEAKDKQYRKYLQERLKDKDDLIASYREQITQITSIRQGNTELIGIIKTMAEKENFKNYFHQPQIGNFIDTAQSGSRQQSINYQHNYAPEQKQTLAEAAVEIQQLLKQLEQANPSATEADQSAFLTAVIPPTKKQRFANALREGGKELLKEFMDNIYLNVVIATIEGWQSAE